MSRGSAVARDYYDLAESIETRALGLGGGAAWESGVCKPWSTEARPKQEIDWKAKWFLWLFLCGRGWGKTWTVFGNSVDRWKRGIWKRTALVAPTQDDVRKLVMEDDESGLLAMCYAEGLEARIKPGTSKLVVEIGSGRDTGKVLMYSAERPGRLRNKQHDSAILDEMREMVGLEAVYDNLIRGLRLGQDPRIIGGTTPPGVVGAKKTGAAVQSANREFIRGVLRGGEYVRREHGQPPPLMGRPSTVVVTGPSDENLDNISPTYEEQAIEPYRGTRIGKQEIRGEFVDEIEGAILSLQDIEAYRIEAVVAPDFDVVGVSVDPAGRHKLQNSETGIVGGGRGWPDGLDIEGQPLGKAHAYITADASGRYKPLGWARASSALYNRLGADWMLGEINHGGDMVESNVKTFDDSVRFRMVTASRGKHVRIAPCLSLVQQGRVHHVGLTDDEKAVFEVLEDQLTQFTDDGWQGTGSPDHADAWAYLVSELLLGDLRTGYALTF